MKARAKGEISREMVWWSAIYRVSCAVLALLLAVGLFSMFQPRIAQYLEFRGRRETLREAAAREEERAAELRRRRERLQTDPSYAERVAHDLGLARTNQVLFQVIDDDGGQDAGNSAN